VVQRDPLELRPFDLVIVPNWVEEMKFSRPRSKPVSIGTAATARAPFPVPGLVSDHSSQAIELDVAAVDEDFLELRPSPLNARLHPR
jgi:hypothetical protein